MVAVDAHAHLSQKEIDYYLKTYPILSQRTHLGEWELTGETAVEWSMAILPYFRYEYGIYTIETELHLVNKVQGTKLVMVSSAKCGGSHLASQRCEITFSHKDSMSHINTDLNSPYYTKLATEQCDIIEQKVDEEEREWKRKLASKE